MSASLIEIFAIQTLTKGNDMKRILMLAMAALGLAFGAKAELKT